MRIPIYCLAALFVLSACSTAMKTEDVRQLQSNCSNVSSQIAMLETEKKNNDNRLRAGVTSILPITAVANLLNEGYTTNVEVATGEWAAAIDKKLSELYVLKTHCQRM